MGVLINMQDDQLNIENVDKVEVTQNI